MVGVSYSARRYTNSSFVFQLNVERKSACSEKARYAYMQAVRVRRGRKGATQK